jgi:hypothetical protein
VSTNAAPTPGLTVPVGQLGSYFRRAFRLAITTNPRLALLLAGCTLAAGVFIWKPCWRARITPRRSRPTASADASWTATARFFEGCTGGYR